MKANSVGKSFALGEIPSFCQVLLFEKRIRVVVEWMVCGQENKFSLYPSPIAQPW
jgi:hypothetical protein